MLVEKTLGHTKIVVDYDYDDVTEFMTVLLNRDSENSDDVFQQDYQDHLDSLDTWLIINNLLPEDAARESEITIMYDDEHTLVIYIPYPLGHIPSESYLSTRLNDQVFFEELDNIFTGTDKKYAIDLPFPKPDHIRHKILKSTEINNYLEKYDE